MSQVEKGKALMAQLNREAKEFEKLRQAIADLIAELDKRGIHYEIPGFLGKPKLESDTVTERKQQESKAVECL